MLAMQRRGDPVDGVLLAAELNRLGALDSVGGQSRLAELAALAPAASNVRHYAALVMEAAQSRNLYNVALALQKASLNGGISMHPEIVDQMREALDLAARLPGEPAIPAGPIFVTAHEFAASHFEPPDPLLGTSETAILAAGSLNLLAGRPGTGKTTTALDMCCHLAAGEPWPPVDPQNSKAPTPWPCPRPLSIAIIVNEGPQEMFRAKVQDKLERFPYSIREAGGKLIVQSLNWGSFSFRDRGIYDRLRDELDQHEVDLVVGDPLASLGLEGVGSPAETLDFVNLLKPLGLGTNRAFLFLHHFRERVEKGEDEVSRLSGAWGGHLDTLITLQAGAQINQSRLWYPKLRWNSREAPPAIVLGRILNTRSVEAIGEEADHSLLEPQVHAFLARSRETGEGGMQGWRKADEIAKGIEARPMAVRNALEGAAHLFRMVTDEAAKALGAKTKTTKLWGLVEWDEDAGDDWRAELATESSDELAEQEAFPDRGADDIPF